MKVTPFVLASALIAVPLSAAAQGTARKVPKDPKWTFEVIAGGAMSSSPGDGSGSAAPGLPVGETFTTEGGTPSRAVHSWYFGDGATLFNQVRQQFASLGAQFPGIVPLDEALGSAALSRGTGATFGARLTRKITNRVALEVSVQNSQGKLTLSEEARTGIEAARASFDSAFRGLFDTMPQTGLQVTSAATLPGAVSGSQTSITGAVRITLTKKGRIETYVTAGAGRVTNSGEVAEVRMRGAYQFRFLDTYAFSEVDSATIRYSESESATIGVFGGGLAFDVSSRQGVRLDVRVHAGDSSVKTTLQSSPVNNASLPALGLPSNTSPAIQFSNTAALKSSLSGRLSETDVFTGSGLETRVLATIGYFFRF
jgi:hypothetical protein